MILRNIKNILNIYPARIYGYMKIDILFANFTVARRVLICKPFSFSRFDPFSFEIKSQPTTSGCLRFDLSLLVGLMRKVLCSQGPYRSEFDKIWLT